MRSAIKTTMSNMIRRLVVDRNYEVNRLQLGHHLLTENARVLGLPHLAHISNILL
jgi:hypothetical protein